MTIIRHFGIAVVAFIFSMQGQSIAQSGIGSLENGRIQSVEGQILDDQTTGEVIVSPQNTRPGTEQAYSFSSSSGNYTKSLKLFPGLNLIQAATATGSRSSSINMRVDPPRLRITLSWSGGGQDYDLYVNSIYYSNKASGGGTLDTDWTTNSGPVVETVLYPAAPAGLYRVYVNYYANHNASPQTTYVRIYLNEKQIYSGSYLLTQPNSGNFGNGAGVWNVATVVLHSGVGSGGYLVDGNGYRDIAKQGAFVGISPRTTFNVSELKGNAGAGPICLVVGRSAQFSATGILNYGSGNQQAGQNIVEQFTMQTISGNDVATIDDLGVLTALSPGQVRVSCNGFSGSPIDVFVVSASVNQIKGLFTGQGIYQSGYISSDNSGRIYCNAQYDSSDVSKVVWSKNKQFVDITVNVTPSNAVLPSDAKIVWEVEDPDDTSDLGMSPNASAIIDVNGCSGNDNNGTRDGADIWEQIESYTLSGANNNETSVNNGISKIRFNVTDVGGDNYIIKAKIKINSFTARDNFFKSGIITVWKRVKLQRTQMVSAKNIDCTELNSSLGKAFVEFDLQPTSSVPDGIILTGTPLKWAMGTNRAAAFSACGNYVKAPSEGEFTHAGEGSWFFLASAEYFDSPSGATSVQLVNPVTNGLSAVLSGNSIYLPIPIVTNQNPASIVIWKDINEFTNRGSKYVAMSCKLDPNDINRRTLSFDSWSFPYYQPVDDKFTSDQKDLNDLGFTNGEYIVAEVMSAGALNTTGISPSDPATAKFRGRTIVFRNGNNSTISHELVHGLGMAHLCGHRDYTGSQTCLMHYGHFWLLKADGTLDRWIRGAPGLQLCPEHIRALRNTKLEDESKSRKLDW
jgi:hypothetical protein